MEIGKIEIMKSFSFFEVDEKFSKPLIGALNGKDFNGTVVKVENSRPAPSRSRDRARKDGFNKSRTSNGFNKSRTSNRSKNRLKRSMDNRKFRNKKK